MLEMNVVHVDIYICYVAILCTTRNLWCRVRLGYILIR